ncbi:MAG: hypothetical protein Ct9H300mP32_6920 [Verrucomicrobiota bacterium]|nr:MAG: hypothetical protein Ct9H300mP32_6920 [Verrucomicrobiota bacterium]
MKQHRNEPMMLYFPMALTHGPLVPTPEEPKITTGKDKFKAMVRYTDKLVGRLVNTLDELKIRDHTLVIFTTDNGTSGGMRGTVNGRRPSGGKGSKFEGGVCQPFIVNCPGLVPGDRKTDALTDFSDLLPTFAELGQAKLPKGVMLDGKSFAPLLLGRQTTRRATGSWRLATAPGGSTKTACAARTTSPTASFATSATKPGWSTSQKSPRCTTLKSIRSSKIIYSTATSLSTWPR